MPSYKAPVDDVMFLLNDVFHIDRYNNLPGFAEATPDLVEAVLGGGGKIRRTGADAAQPRRRQGGLPPPRRRLGDDADRVQGRLSEAHRRRLDRHLGARRVRRPGPADGAGAGAQRVPLLGEHGVRHVSRPHRGRDRGAAHARLAGAEGALSAEAGRRAVVRHHEPDRAAMRHRSRPGAHPRHAAGRRQLQDHRHQDLHFRRRARSGREHRSSRAGPYRRRAGRHPRHFAVHRAEIPARCRRQRSARAMRCRAARSRRRWASTATPPA